MEVRSPDDQNSGSTGFLRVLQPDGDIGFFYLPSSIETVYWDDSAQEIRIFVQGSRESGPEKSVNLITIQGPEAVSMRNLLESAWRFSIQAQMGTS